MDFDFEALMPILIEGGSALAGGLLADDTAEQKQEDAKELEAMRLADNERQRILDQKLSDEELASLMARARLSSETELATTKKKILGENLLKQGAAQQEALTEAMKAAANRPREFNDAANILAQILAK